MRAIARVGWRQGRSTECRQRVEGGSVKSPTEKGRVRGGCSCVSRVSGGGTMRRTYILTVLGALLGGTLSAAADDKTRGFTFRKDDVGRVPPGWKADKTGTGEGSVWKVVADDTA